MSYSAIISILGWTISLFAVAMAATLLVALGYGEIEEAGTFLAAALVTLFSGGGMIFATREASRAVSRREGFLIAVVVWTVLPIFGALPLYFGGVETSALDAYFEAMSALTTTGATVLSGLDDMARSVLFWRALMQWIGGLGAIMLAVAVLSMLGIGGLSLYRSALPQARDTIGGRLRHAVGSIWYIYAGLTALCAALLWAAGMEPFDAIAHAFSTLSTGGFSTRDASIGGFDDPVIEIVLIVFMLVAAVNFTLHWAAAYGRFSVYREDPEFRYYLLLAALVAALMFAALAGNSAIAPGDAARHGAFTAISVLTTSGFINVSETSDVAAGFLGWPIVLPTMILALMFVGGCAGSTAGGIKLMRVLILLKQGGRELQRLSYPHGVVSMRYGGVVVTDPALRGVWSLFMMFVVSFGVLTVALAASGVDFRVAAAFAAGSLSNAGPAALLVADQGFGAYAALPAGAKVAVIVGMLMGRVELFAFLTLFNPAFWRR